MEAQSRPNNDSSSVSSHVILSRSSLYALPYQCQSFTSWIHGLLLKHSQSPPCPRMRLAPCPRCGTIAAIRQAIALVIGELLFICRMTVFQTDFDLLLMASRACRPWRHGFGIKTQCRSELFRRRRSSEGRARTETGNQLFVDTQPRWE
ncbi:hypothetical protein LIA77_06764 [Sarocladium implicatum]|nr:hypothetical protein LIA77_06764 [Sarocladium implicatum]